MLHGPRSCVVMAVLVTFVPMAYVLAYTTGFHQNDIRSVCKYVMEALEYYVAKVLPEFLRQASLVPG